MEPMGRYYLRPALPPVEDYRVYLIMLLGAALAYGVYYIFFRNNK